MNGKVRFDDRGNPYRRERIGGQLREIYLEGSRLGGLVAMRVDGLDDTIQQLRALGASINSIFRIAARRSGTRLKDEVKALLPVRRMRSIYNGKKVLTYGLSGQLRKSISTRVLTSRKGVVHAIIGPSRQSIGYAFKKWHKPTRNHQVEINSMQRVKPSNYWHLFEKGFNANFWRTGKMRFIPGKGVLAKVLGPSASVVAKDTKDVFEEQQTRVLNKRQALLEAL
jgi:hypothetical protein